MKRTELNLAERRTAAVSATRNTHLDALCDRLNRTPRKCLRWRTSTEAFAEELRKLGERNVAT